MGFTILRGGRVLDIAAGTAAPADILVEDDTIREIGPPGCAAPDGAAEIDAGRRLIHPGSSTRTLTRTATSPRGWATAGRSSCC